MYSYIPSANTLPSNDIAAIKRKSICCPISVHHRHWELLGMEARPFYFTDQVVLQSVLTPSQIKIVCCCFMAVFVLVHCYRMGGKYHGTCTCTMAIHSTIMTVPIIEASFTASLYKQHPASIYGGQERNPQEHKCYMSSFLSFFSFLFSSIFCNILAAQSQLIPSFLTRITQVTDFQQEHPDRGRQDNQYALNHSSWRCCYTAANTK